MRSLALAVSAALICVSLTAVAGLLAGRGKEHTPGTPSPPPPPPGQCAQATTFLARTSGLDTGHSDAYVTYICGLVADGVIPAAASMASTGVTPYCGPKLDALWVMATEDATTANKDICGHTAYTLVPNGSPAFLANEGYSGVDASTTVYLDTGFNPATAGGDFVQNSAHVSVWSLTNAQSTSSGGVPIGSNGTSLTQISPWHSDGNLSAAINVGGSQYGSQIGNIAVTDSGGFFVISRTASNLQTLYKNGSSVGTNAAASAAPGSLPLYLLARNEAGSAAAGSGLRLAMASVGAGLSLTDVASLNTRGCAFITKFRGSCSAPIPPPPLNTCSGSSPDPQATRDGFTSPKFCLDFTQTTLPANWLLCPITNTPGYLLYGGWEFGGGFPGCGSITHETDPTTGKLAMHLSFTVGSDNSTASGVEVMSAPNSSATVGNFFEQGYYSIKYRLETTPSVPAPQYVVPAVNYSFYQGDLSPQFEFDVHEQFSIFPNCPDMNILDWSGGNGGMLFGANPPACPNNANNPNQYQTWATRVTGDGTTRGYTGYVNGSVIGGFTRGYTSGTQQASGLFQVWNSPFSCSYGNWPCTNAAVTSAYNCGGRTCVTLDKAVFVGTGVPPNCGQGANAYITGSSGIAGLNGLHQPCAQSTTNTNPSATFELTDMAWPGGSYGGGGQWNALSKVDVWVENIQVWTCPAWDQTVRTHSTNQCNGAVLSGAP